jgi:hypothetical protein
VSTTKTSNPLIQAEPVIAAHLAAAGVGYVLTLLVTHGVISSTQSSAVAQQAISFATAVLIAGLGFLVRRFVTPSAKVQALIDAELAKLAPASGLDLAPDPSVTL